MVGDANLRLGAHSFETTEVQMFLHAILDPRAATSPQMSRESRSVERV